jgi:7-carboxy-7-deazaguanine synthase
MKVNEIFYSIQGEGGRAGEPSIFIRLAECDLACTYCDTEFESGREMTVDEVLGEIAAYPCRWIVWTGGEPSLQLTAEIVDAFKEKGYKQAIETNGNNPAPEGLDWVAVSPKVAEHVLKKNFPKGVTELRYVRHKGQKGVPDPSVSAQYYYLSPIFNGDRPDWENIRHCIDLCLQNPRWKLSLQMHKFLKVL